MRLLLRRSTSSSTRRSLKTLWREYLNCSRFARQLPTGYQWQRGATLLSFTLEQAMRWMPCRYGNWPPKNRCSILFYLSVQCADAVLAHANQLGSEYYDIYMVKGLFCAGQVYTHIGISQKQREVRLFGLCYLSLFMLKKSINRRK
jgi:hypothetical protein